MTHGEAYLDIVWRQFKKNRPALVALWAVVPLVLVAVFAPLLASNQPLVFHEGDRTLYPWFRALFNTTEPVDFAFNMALIGFFPWAATAAALNALWKHVEWPGRRRVLTALGAYAVIIVGLCVLFSFPSLRPANTYSSWAFAELEFKDPAEHLGRYPLIPLGPAEHDLPAHHKPPGFQKTDMKDWTKCTDGFRHWLGTDDSGRDVMVRMIYGTRVALTVGFVAVGIYLAIGIVVGAIAGYFGGMTDILISRVMEVVMLLPSFFLILTLVAMLGQSIYIIMAVFGITGWPGIARLIRGEVLKQRAMDYTAAARALGASSRRIIFRHILPNALSPALVAAPFGIADAIVTEAGLSLLGFGVAPPAPTWGSLLELGRENYAYWWLIVFPSLAIFLTVTLLNLVGSGLRDAMDPRLRK